MKFNNAKFIALFTAKYGKLDPAQFAGLNFLLESIAVDEKITLLDWVAYILATTYHETAKTWQPIAEYGKGHNRAYGVPDVKTGQAYYGRGYVQLTWKDNYATMGKVFGLDFVHEPELVMRPETAYQIMSHGMRKGFFTGVGLPKYITADKCDFLNARRIINGTDCAARIASYATAFAAMLEQSLLPEDTDDVHGL